MISKTAIIRNSSIGVGSRVWEYANIYDAKIGDNVTIGSFVEIQSDVTIGNNVTLNPFLVYSRWPWRRRAW